MCAIGKVYAHPPTLPGSSELYYGQLSAHVARWCFEASGPGRRTVVPILMRQVRSKTKVYRSIAFAAGVLALLVAAAPLSADKPTFTVGWSVYVGWNPYYFMNKSGIMKKWADKYGIAIKVQRFDYAPSLDAFVAKNIEACAMTNMEALDMPAAAGVDTTAIIVGDYSNGNDAVLTRNGVKLKDLPGKKLLLVEKTVSQYLFERGMALNGLESQIKRCVW